MKQVNDFTTLIEGYDNGIVGYPTKWLHGIVKTSLLANDQNSLIVDSSYKELYSS